MITNHIFFEILSAICLSNNLVPKLIQKISPKMEQILVQRCETEIVTDACNASYLMNDHNHWIYHHSLMILV